MIVLSFLLVLVAAVTLIIGLFQDTLVWIWASIGSCVAAMLFLGVGVLQRRSAKPADADADSGYGPGAISGLLRDESEKAPEAEEEEEEEEEEDVTVVPKRTAAEAQESEAEAAPAAWGGTAPEDRAPGDAAEAPAEEGEEEPAVEPEEEPAVEPAASKTTGAAARRQLAEVKGLGRAKQDALLDRFGSLEAILAADVEDLQQVKGFGSATAQQVHTQLADLGDGEAAPAKTRKKTTKKAAAKKTAAKKAAKKTTGAPARKRLAEVKGLGPAKQKALLDRFGSLEGIGDAEVSELQEVKGIGEATAREIQKELS